MKYDICIVGGGVVGLAIAYYLKKFDRRLRVGVFEKRYFGYGGSTRNAGHFRVHFWTYENSKYASESIKLLMKFMGETGWNPTIMRSGYLWLISDERVWKAYEDTNTRIWSRLGNPVIFMDIDEVSKKYPYLNLDGFIGAVFGPQDGKLHHDIVVYGYLDRFRRMDGEAHPYTPVLTINVKNGKVKGIDLGHKTVECEKVIVAAGEGSRILFDSLEIEIPIKIKRKELYVSEPYSLFIDPLVIDTREDSMGLYITQSLRGELMGSLDYPEAYDDLTHETTLEHYIVYAKKLVRLVPILRYSTIMRCWSGNYVTTPDNSHIMGRDPYWPEGLYVATGFSGHGFMLAPYTGYLMARHVIYGETPDIMQPYTPERFREGKLINESLVIG